MSAMRLILTAMLALFLTTGAQAGAELGYRTYSKTGNFEDVRDDLKDAIINRGFVIDYVGHFNTMLERTAEAAQSVTKEGIKSPYRNAQFVQFCPAKLVHESASANPIGIANCPVAVFVYELRIEPGKIHVGYRLPVASPSIQVKKINDKLVALLHEIATESTK